MSSGLSEDILNRLTKSLMLRVFGDAAAEEEADEEDAAAASQGPVGDESNSEEAISIDTSEQCVVQTDRDDSGNLSVEHSAQEDDKSAKSDTMIDICSTDEESSRGDNGNDSDVIEMVSDNEVDDMFKKLEGQRMDCPRCYPRQIFQPHQKALYIIHRKRHFAEDHFICPTCREAFVKLFYCIQHELVVHKEDTLLNDRRFTSAVSLILNSGKNTPNSSTTLIGTESNSVSENSTPENLMYCDYAVASSSTCPYSGPPVDRYRDAYEIQYKYGRPKKCQLNSIVENIYDGSSSSESDSSYLSQRSRRQLSTSRKTMKTVQKSNSKTYCCKLCHFICYLEVEFKEHFQAKHPNSTVDQVVKYLVIASGSISGSPVRKKKTNNGPSSKRRSRLALSEDSTRNSFTGSSTLSSESLVTQDYSTQEGFCAALGLVRKGPS